VYISYDEEARIQLRMHTWTRGGNHQATNRSNSVHWVDVTFEGFLLGFDVEDAEHLVYVRWLTFNLQSL